MCCFLTEISACSTSLWSAAGGVHYYILGGMLFVGVYSLGVSEVAECSWNSNIVDWFLCLYVNEGWGTIMSLFHPSIVYLLWKFRSFLTWFLFCFVPLCTCFSPIGLNLCSSQRIHILVSSSLLPRGFNRWQPLVVLAAWWDTWPAADRGSQYLILIYLIFFLTMWILFAENACLQLQQFLTKIDAFFHSIRFAQFTRPHFPEKWWFCCHKHTVCAPFFYYHFAWSTPFLIICCFIQTWSKITKKGQLCFNDSPTKPRIIFFCFLPVHLMQKMSAPGPNMELRKTPFSRRHVALLLDAQTLFFFLQPPPTFQPSPPKFFNIDSCFLKGPVKGWISMNPSNWFVFHNASTP